MSPSIYLSLGLGPQLFLKLLTSREVYPNSGGDPVSSNLLEERQVEMRQRMLQERAHRKKHQLAREPKGVMRWDTSADKPQVESEPLEKTRVESAIERHPNGSTSVSRDDLYTLVWTEEMTAVAARFGVSANYLARVCDHLNVPHPQPRLLGETQRGVC